MATFTMDMPPALSGESKDAAQLRSYLARLVDRLLYCLNHLDDENLVEGGVGISRITGGSSALAGAVVQEMGNAQMGTGNVQHLRAQVAEIVTAVIQHAVVDWANLRHLTAEEAIVAKFVGTKMFIDSLAVTSAQMVDLTVGQLCIKAKDGNYYTLDVDLKTGTVTATLATVSLDELEAGQTESGKHIIESDLTVQELNATSIYAVEALIDKITAKRIDVDYLMAQEAMIRKLTTGEIAAALGESLNLSSNQSIQSTVRQITGAENAEITTRLNQITQTANRTELAVRDLQNGLGTHLIV